MNRRTSRCSFVAICCALGCAASETAPPLTADMFMRATPIVEQGPAPVASPSAPTREAHELVSLPTDGDTSPAPTFPATERPIETKRSSSPTAVIAEANRVASQAPEAEGFLNAVMTYNFVSGGIYHVFTAPENVTDLVLEPGEEIMGEPAAGDTLRWRLGVGASAVGGVPQSHVFIKPTRAGLSTNLTLNTNRRTYFLKLESVERDCMVAVQWNYPGREEASFEPADAPGPTHSPDSARPADAAALNFDYVVEVVKGRPAWRPQAIFDDGQKTFIRFDPSMLHGESPALFVIERGELQIVNYRVKKNLYVVDRLFRVAELRLGQDEQDILRIRRKSEPPLPSPRAKKRGLRPYGVAP